MGIFDSKKETAVFAFAGLLLLFVLPCLNAFTTEGSPLHVSGFQLSLWGKYITYAVLAISLNML
jgi:urea transport system permease protein